MKCPQCGHNATYLAKADTGSDVLVCVRCGYMGTLVQVQYNPKALRYQEEPEPMKDAESR